MKALIVLALTLLVSSNSFSQTYLFTFSGELDPFSITKLENECSQLKDVKSTKIKYKPESHKGELYVTLIEKKKSVRTEKDESFSPIPLKSFLLSKNLSPLSFRELKK